MGCGLGADAGVHLCVVFFYVYICKYSICVCMRVFVYVPPQASIYMCLSVAGLVEQRGLGVCLSAGAFDLRAWREHFCHPTA